MAIGAELLNPIAGPTPGGASLRYDPLYDKLREARREEEDVPQGDWVHEIKKADWQLVIKLCTEALANKTKDLQLAAWLTEALVRREGFAGLREGLELCRGLIEQFWDSLYPEVDDGDFELRAVPLEWVGNRLDEALKRVPITKSGLSWFKYRESRAIPYEAEIGGSDQKRAAREEAAADGKLTPEEFDKAALTTSEESYRKTLADIEASQAALQLLAEACESRFGEFKPSFSGLEESLATFQQFVKGFLKHVAAEPVSESGVETEAAADVEVLDEEASSAVVTPKAKPVPAGEPADKDDALARITSIARWLRQQNVYDPLPYILLRAMRWGELRGSGSDIDAEQLVPPSTELRQKIRKLANEGSWEELIGTCEEAMALPCGRGWLDLQRYFATACESYGGFDAVERAVVAELKALLADYPAIPALAMLDDTPTANPETRAWLESLVAPQVPEVEEPEVFEPSVPQDTEEGPDVFELAKDAARSGRFDQAIELLTKEAGNERSGRARFQRRVQLAQLCISADKLEIAYPILDELAREIEQRKLDAWESSDVIVQPLMLLYRCVQKLKDGSDQKDQLFARICQLDPIRALELAK